MISPRRTERSRQLILDAADALFRDVGFAHVSIEDIAIRAGLSRKTVYNLFASKEDIALKLIARVEAGDAHYRALIAQNENVFMLLEKIFLDSASWCLANPSLAKLALAPTQRPSLAPPADRPSFQGLVRDVVILGQLQGFIRKDDDANFMALILLGIYGQAMLTALAGGPFSQSEIQRIIRIVVEGIGDQSTLKSQG